MMHALPITHQSTKNTKAVFLLLSSNNLYTVNKTTASTNRATCRVQIQEMFIII